MILGGVILAIAYPLSMGPTYRLALNDQMDLDTFNTIYAPINAPYRWEPMRHAVLWYLSLWEPRS